MSKAHSDDSNILHWNTPAMSALTGSPVSPEEQAQASRENEEKRKKVAYDLGFQLGKKEALEGFHEELTSKLALLEELIAAVQKPLDEMNNQVVEELAFLSGSIARQLVRRELKTDPGTILSIVREAVAPLPKQADEISVHLHPEDSHLLKELAQLTSEDRSWTIVEDPTLLRGDCKVTTADSFINATMEARINNIVAAMLGGERGSDKPW